MLTEQHRQHARRADRRDVRLSPHLGEMSGDDVMSCSRAEVRWFIEPDAVAEPLLDWFHEAGPSQRVDLYHVPTLMTCSAIKARAGEQLELKVLGGSPRIVRIGTITATAELWVKQQLDVRRSDLMDGWLAVTKLLVDARTFEVAYVTVGDIRAWSLAVKARRLRRALRDKQFRRWLPAVAGATNAGYPAWIGSLEAPRSSAVR